MAIQRPGRITPAPIAPLSWARNGRAPSAGLGGRLLRGLAGAVAHRRKCVFSKHVALNDVPAGAAALTTWRAYCRTGYAATGKIELVFDMVFAPTAQNSEFRRVPYVYWDVNGTSTDYLYSTTSPAGTVTPNDLVYGTIRYAVAPDTEYALKMIAADYVRPVSCVIYEEHSPVYNDGGESGMCDPTSLVVREPITTDEISAIQDTPHALWKHNASHLFSWCTDEDPDNGGDAPAITSASLVPIFEGSGSPGASSVGWHVQANYHQPYHSDNVPVVFCVCAKLAATPADVDIQLYSVTDAAQKILLEPTLTTNAAWYTGTGYLDGTNDIDHLVVQASTSASTLTIYALSLYEYDGTYEGYSVLLSNP